MLIRNSQLLEMFQCGTFYKFMKTLLSSLHLECEKYVTVKHCNSHVADHDLDVDVTT